MNEQFSKAPQPDEAPFPWQSRYWEALLADHRSGRLAHAYLICGESGLGKRRFALAFARYLLCGEPQDGRACGRCSHCLSGGGDFHPDILPVAHEEQSRDIRIDQVRGLGDFLRQTPHGGRAKIVILEGAHALNISAANALLKTLEEPTSNSYLFLVTDMPGMLMATVRSRCRRVLMHGPSWERGWEWLRQSMPELQKDYSESDIHRLWQEAGPRPLHLRQMLEQDYPGQREAFEQALCRLAQGTLNLTDLVQRAARQGETAVLGHLGRLSTILIKYQATGELPAAASPELRRLSEAVPGSPHGGREGLLRLLEFYREVNEASRQLAGGTNPNPRLILESLLYRWWQLGYAESG